MHLRGLIFGRLQAFSLMLDLFLTGCTYDLEGTTPRNTTVIYSKSFKIDSKLSNVLLRSRVPNQLSKNLFPIVSIVVDGVIILWRSSVPRQRSFSFVVHLTQHISLNSKLDYKSQNNFTIFWHTHYIRHTKGPSQETPPSTQHGTITTDTSMYTDQEEIQF